TLNKVDDGVEIKGSIGGVYKGELLLYKSGGEEPISKELPINKDGTFRIVEKEDYLKDFEGIFLKFEGDQEVIFNVSKEVRDFVFQILDDIEVEASSYSEMRPSSVENIGPAPGMRSIIKPTVPTHTYKFFVDGKEIEDPNNNQIIKDHELVLEPKVPYKPDHIFDGWYEEGSEDKFIFNTPIKVTETKDINLHARFKEEIRVEFIKDSVVLMTKIVEKGSTTNADGVPLVVTEDDKVFSHWSIKPNGDEFNFKEPINAHTKLYAVLVAGYKVNFKTHGGSAVNMVIVQAGETLKDVTIPTTTKSGYTFKHWSLTKPTDENPTPEEYTMGDEVNEDLTLHAVWDPLDSPYTVVYWQENADDEKYTYVETVKKTGKSGTQAVYEDKKYENFTLNNNLTIVPKINTEPGKPTIVNVYYDRVKYNLEFREKNTDVALPNLQFSVKWGASIKPHWDKALAKYPNYRWGRNKDHTGTWYTLPPIMPKKELILYGGVLGNVKYTYFYKEKIDGKPQLRDPLIFYSKYSEAGIFPSKEDFVKIPGFEPIIPEPIGKFDENNEYTILYKRLSYNMTFKANDFKNTVIEEKNIPYETDISNKVPAAYKKGETIRSDGYIFDGWYDNENLVGDAYVLNTMPAHNLILYGKWVPPIKKVKAHKTIEESSEAKIVEVTSGEVISNDQREGIDKYIGENGPDLGWFYYVSGKFTKFDFGTPIISDIDLYPVSKASTVTLTVKNYYGENKDFEEKYIKGKIAIVPNPGKEFKCKTNKRFLGWQIADENGNGTGTIYKPGDTIVVDDNITLVAACGDENTQTTLTYDGNGGVTDDGKTIQKYDLANNDTHIVIDNPGFKKTGYVFDGWKATIGGEGKVLKVGESIQVDRLNAESHNKLYAIWVKETIDVTAT
ncbi:MAG: InlB B-repeat-containing protein, partial [Tissierellia bacterium]|nr:InlB B-repeat-containing protein [Tissierellia bacterium]